MVKTGKKSKSAKSSTAARAAAEELALQQSELENNDIAVERPCDACGKPLAKRCARCNVARYCSTSCAQAEFTGHKRWCKELAAARDGAPPPPELMVAAARAADLSPPDWAAVAFAVRLTLASDTADAPLDKSLKCGLAGFAASVRLHRRDEINAWPPPRVSLLPPSVLHVCVAGMTRSRCTARRSTGWATPAPRRVRSVQPSPCHRRRASPRPRRARTTASACARSGGPLTQRNSACTCY